MRHIHAPDGAWQRSGVRGQNAEKKSEYPTVEQGMSNVQVSARAKRIRITEV